MTDYLDILKKRRSIYAIGKNVNQSNQTISSIITSAIKHSPSAFNSQSVKAVITFDEASDKIWDITAEVLEAKIGTEKFQPTKAKLASFKAGKGTILFFTDKQIVKNLQERFPLYAANFEIWAEQALGGAQQAVWTALAQAEIGASLQHYNPLIDEKIAKEFSLPAHWELKGQMPFGSIEQLPEAKEFLADEERFIIFE